MSFPFHLSVGRHYPTFCELSALIDGSDFLCNTSFSFGHNLSSKCMFSTWKHLKLRHSVIILGDSQRWSKRLLYSFCLFVTSPHKNGWTNSHPNLEIMLETVWFEIKADVANKCHNFPKAFKIVTVDWRKPYQGAVDPDDSDPQTPDHQGRGSWISHTDCEREASPCCCLCLRVFWVGGSKKWFIQQWLLRFLTNIWTNVNNFLLYSPYTEQSIHTDRISIGPVLPQKQRENAHSAGDLLQAHFDLYLLGNYTLRSMMSNHLFFGPISRKSKTIGLREKNIPET